MKKKRDVKKIGYAIIALSAAYVLLEAFFYLRQKYSAEWGNVPSANLVFPLEDGIYMVLLSDREGQSFLEKRGPEDDSLWRATTGKDFHNEYSLYAALNGNHLFVDGDVLYLFHPGEKDEYLKFNFNTGASLGSLDVPDSCRMPYFHTLNDGDVIYHPTQVEVEKNRTQCALCAIEKSTGKVKWTTGALGYSLVTPLQNQKYIFFPVIRDAEHEGIIIDKQTGRVLKLKDHIYGVLRDDVLFSVSRTAIQKKEETPSGADDDNPDDGKHRSEPDKERQFELSRVELPSLERTVIASWKEKSLCVSNHYSFYSGQPPVFFYGDSFFVFEQKDKKVALTFYSLKDGARLGRLLLPEGYEPFMDYLSWVRSGNPDAYPYLDVKQRFLPMLSVQKKELSFQGASKLRLMLAVFDLKERRLSFDSRPFVADSFATSQIMQFHTFLADGSYHLLLHIGNRYRDTYLFTVDGETGKMDTPYRLLEAQKDGRWEQFYLVDARHFLPSLFKHGLHYLVRHCSDRPNEVVRLDFKNKKIFGTDELKLVPMPQWMRKKLGWTTEAP